MNTTGIVRRIDDLGRRVIPKEIRKTLRIKDGDPLEINISNENIILKKYSTLEDIRDVFKIFIDKISVLTAKNILICDRDKIICGAGGDIESFVGKNISNDIYHFMEERKKEYVNNTMLSLTDKKEINSHFIFSSMITNGDVVGGVVFFGDDEVHEMDKVFLNLILDIFVKYIEE